ncbi:MAG: undecaprenyldiphospho-muramoylpentapeptide beta-N-acetylglucosaminyltransferase [Steroidobacteraceae bacterium]
MSGRVLIMAGGTGGHVFPALAVARALAARQREVVWLGTKRGIEARLVPAAGIPVEWVDIGGLRGKGPGSLLFAPFQLLQATWQALRIIRRLRPAVVLGCGGFVSGPGGVAARLTRTPLVIHEQNAVAGLTNRLLCRLADRVATAFPGSFPAGIRREIAVVGNPVRAEIVALPAPAARFASRQGPVRLLVFGGSQGARAINGLMPAALASIPREVRPIVVHQCGRGHEQDTLAAYERHGVKAHVREFIEDMPGAYEWADLAVCRSGALTVAELAAAGLGAVLIPFPAAVDDHQTHNARFLVEAGAARLAPEAGLTSETLTALLVDLTSRGREGLAAMAAAARRVAVTDAADRVAALCLEVERRPA